mgnify:CR=1 FL=1
MKIKKQLKRISLILLVLIVLVGCFNVSYGSVLGDLASKIGSKIGDIAVEGIVAVLTVGLQLLATMFFGALHVITIAITGVSGDTASTIGSVVFNKCTLTSANFFKEVWVGEEPKFGNASQSILDNISQYYYIMRNLAIALLLGILLYIGIRMAISTVASQEAKYKKMLKDWTVSLVLVFVLHYIIIITFFVNNTIVHTLSELDKTSGRDYAGMILQGLIPGYGMADVVVYGALVTATLAFVLMYLKRTIVLGFLIVIAPLITVTYSIDKIGDGKSQALNAWLKEFIFTVIIQPFHCIIYLVFYSSMMQALDGANELDVGNVIFAIACAFFMLKAEGIVKKIFGVQPNSIGDAIGTGAMAITMATSMFKGRGKKLADGKGEMRDMKNNASRVGDNLSNNAARNQRAANEGTTGQVNPDANAAGGTNGANGSNGSSTTGGANATGGNNQNSGGSNNGNSRQQPAQQSSDAKDKPSLYERFKNSNYIKRRGGISEWAGRKISGAATMAGFIAGATVGDFKTASSVATATGGIASSKYDDIKYRSAERKLEQNQRVFAGAYNDFVQEYMARNKEATEEEAMAEAMRIQETGGHGLEEYEFDLWNQMDQLKDGAEIMGYSDGFDYVNDTMRLASEGVIEPTDDYIQKVYDRPEETSTTSSSNDSNGSNSSNGSRRNRYRTDEDVDYSDTWDKARKRSQNPDRKTTMDDI